MRKPWFYFQERAPEHNPELRGEDQRVGESDSGVARLCWESPRSGRRRNPRIRHQSGAGGPRARRGEQHGRVGVTSAVRGPARPGTASTPAPTRRYLPAHREAHQTCDQTSG